MEFKVIINNYKRLISAKELYKELNVTEKFECWINDIIDSFRYEVEVDYIEIEDDYAVTIQLAREIVIIENNYNSLLIHEQLRKLQTEYKGEFNFIKIKKKVSWDKFNISEIAKELELPAKHLNKLLEQCGVQIKLDDGWELTEEYKNKRYAIQHTLIDSKTKLEKKYLVWTKDGRSFIKKLFENMINE